MDREQMKDIGARARNALEEIRSVDTAENEQTFISLLATRGVQVERKNIKRADRYRIVLSDGSIEPASLVDLRDLCIKMGLITQ